MKIKRETEKNMESIEKVQTNKKISKGVIALSALALSTSGFAASSGTAGTEDSFGDLFAVFKNWLQGDLGKLLALLGFAGTFIIYLMTHKGSVLIIGVVISLIAGGLVSISNTFFNIGSTMLEEHG